LKLLFDTVFQGKRPQEILQYLVDHRGTEITARKLAAEVFPDHVKAKGLVKTAGLVRTTVSKMRKPLQRYYERTNLPWRVSIADEGYEVRFEQRIADKAADVGVEPRANASLLSVASRVYILIPILLIITSLAMISLSKLSPLTWTSMMVAFRPEVSWELADNQGVGATISDESAHRVNTSQARATASLFCSAPANIRIISRDLKAGSAARRMQMALQQAGCPVEVDPPDNPNDEVRESVLRFFHDEDQRRASEMAAHLARSGFRVKPEDLREWGKRLGKDIPKGIIEIWVAR
jgi:hypothetical protein